jgi:flavin reductase (DIM6/NTAB) family NADH-FMN oxidoreductase RutF
MEKEFLEILRTLSQTVFVLSANDEKERHAMTVSSVTSLSIKPPLMMVGVNKEASINNILEEDSNFCLNLLKSSQKGIADTCSGAEEGEERFKNDLWISSNPVYLKDAQSNIFCKVKEIISYASHSIIVGEVKELIHSGKIEPLIYQNGKYI